MTTGRWVSAGLLLVFVSAGGMLLALRGDSVRIETSADAKPRSRPVPATADPHSPARTYVGVVLAREAVDVTARSEGQIQDLRANPGDRVERGAVLAVLDTARLTSADIKIAEAERTAAEGDVRRLKLELAHATTRRTRTESLAKRQMVAAQDVEEAVYLQQVADARLAAAENVLIQKRAVLDQRRALEEHARLVAPFNGIVSVRYVERGATVTRGTPIVRIVEAGTLRLRFAVPSADAARLKPGLRVEAHIVDLDVRLNGRIHAIAPEVDAASQMLFVYATVDGRRDDVPSSGAIVGRAARVQVPGS